MGNHRKNQDHPLHSIVKFGKNTQWSPGELRRVAINQTTVKEGQLTLVRKTQ